MKFLNIFVICINRCIMKMLNCEISFSFFLENKKKTIHKYQRRRDEK